MKRQIKQTRRLIIVTEHFAPSTGATAQLIKDLADGLHALDISIQILTSTFSNDVFPYTTAKLSFFKSAHSAIRSKLLKGLIFCISSFFWIFFHSGPEDSLLIVSNPPFIGILGPLLRITKRIQYIFLFQDVFPRSATLVGIMPSRGPLHYFWNRLMRVVLNNSKATVVLSDAMKTRCLLDFQTSTSIISIPNWSPITPMKKNNPPLRRNPGNSLKPYSRRLQVQYSGNFGRLHDIMAILECARLLANKPIDFTFIGDGAKRNQIEMFMDYYPSINVSLKPYQSREKLPESLSDADLSIVSMIPGAEDTVAPSKLYGILSVSVPVILIASEESNLAKFVRLHGFGIVVPPGDPQLLASQLIELLDSPHRLNTMSEKALAAYQQNFGKDKSIQLYKQLFSEIEFIN